MKKIFTKNSHVHLLILSVIAFGVFFALRLYSPVSSVFTEPLYLRLAILPPFACIIIGIWAMKYHPETTKPIVSIIFVLLNVVLLFFLLKVNFQQKFPPSLAVMKSTGISIVVAEEVWKRNVTLPDDSGILKNSKITDSFCAVAVDKNKFLVDFFSKGYVEFPWGRFLVDVFDNTNIYEQYGPSFWQKRRVSIETIQPGQVMDIEFIYLWFRDTEVYNLLIAKYGSNAFDYAYATGIFGATKITIRKGEIIPLSEFTEDMRHQAENCSDYHPKP